MQSCCMTHVKIAYTIFSADEDLQCAGADLRTDITTICDKYTQGCERVGNT